MKHTTDDLSFAAFLHSLLYEIVALDRTNPERVGFVFKISDEDWEKYVSIWREGTPQRLYYSSYQALKGMIYND